MPNPNLSTINEPRVSHQLYFEGNVFILDKNYCGRCYSESGFKVLHNEKMRKFSEDEFVDIPINSQEREILMKILNKYYDLIIKFLTNQEILNFLTSQTVTRLNNNGTLYHDEIEDCNYGLVYNNDINQECEYSDHKLSREYSNIQGTGNTLEKVEFNIEYNQIGYKFSQINLINTYKTHIPRIDNGLPPYKEHIVDAIVTSSDKKYRFLYSRTHGVTSVKFMIDQYNFIIRKDIKQNYCNTILCETMENYIKIIFETKIISDRNEPITIDFNKICPNAKIEANEIENADIALNSFKSFT